MAETKIKKEKPPTVDQIITVCCFVFELYAFPWFEDEAGEGIEPQLDCGGVNTTIGGFAGGDKSGVGATSGEGEGERVKKKLERDGDGEGETSGDDIGESEGLSDGEKGSENGDSVEGKGDGERVSVSSSPLFSPFASWRSALLDAISPCVPMCLSQAGKFKHNLMYHAPHS